MSDDESMSEGFSASEDEWKPTKEARGGESSDDDDSDFEESSPIAAVSGGSAASIGKKRGEPKARSAIKQPTTKKRPGLSLRAKLYNKYRPLPKTCSPPSSDGKNSPSASTSRTNSKNAKTPNESSRRHHEEEDDGSSDGSIDNYLVNPDELDIQSSFFNVVETKTVAGKSSVSPIPDFDCNAGLGNLSDSGSENNDSGAENNDYDNFHKNKDTNAFDFHDLLKNANSLERVKETLAKRAAEDAAAKKTGSASKSLDAKIDSMDVYSLLALGEKQHRSHNDGEDEDDEEEEDAIETADKERRVKGPSKLSKTKSTRVKRHTKTRPASTVLAGGDTDDSDFEEVADTSEYADTTATAASDISQHGNLEIHIDLPSRQRDKKTRTQLDLEMALKRKFNREMKERQLLMHKASLLCHFGRTYFYNRVLNDTILMQKALKLLPSRKAYPPEEGTEIKYYQSLVTWFKSTIALTSQNLYPDKKTAKSKALAHSQLLQQIEKRQARCKQDMVFIFIILLRGMGLQCRLVNNMQPLPLKPSQSDLISIKMKQEDKDQGKNTTANKTNISERDSDSKNEDEPSTSSKIKLVEKENKEKQSKVKLAKEDIKGKNSKEKLHQKPIKDTKLASTTKIDKVDTKGKDQKPTSSKTSNNSKQSKAKTNKRAAADSADDHEGKSFEEIPKACPRVGTAKELSDNKQSVVKSKLGYDLVEKQVKNIQTRTNTSAKGTTHIEEKPTNCPRTQKVVKLDLVVNAPTDDKKKRVRWMPQSKTCSLAESSAASEVEVMSQREQQLNENIKKEDDSFSKSEEVENSQKENSSKPTKKSNLARLKRVKAMDDTDRPHKKKPVIETGAPLIPKIVIKGGKEIMTTTTDDPPTTSKRTRVTRSRSKSPQIHISAAFLQTKQYKEKFPGIIQQNTNVKTRPERGKSPIDKVKISTNFLSTVDKKTTNKRILRSCQKGNEGDTTEPNADSNLNSVHLQIPQLDGANDGETLDSSRNSHNKKTARKKKLKKEKSAEDSDEDFEPSPIKKPKIAPALSKKDRRVLSTDDEKPATSPEHSKQIKQTAGDLWVEVWSDVEEQWVCVDLFKGQIHCVETIRKSASSNLAYVFAFQNDLSVKDVTARYSLHWTTVVRKSRIDKAWLDTAIYKYRGHRTKRDIKEDQELRRIHEAKPMPTAIGDYKNHPFYALERHLLKFEALYPPNAPTLGFVRGEGVYSRDCVHTLHSREVWLKQARVVKLGEKPYKIVKARPKWDRITQTVIKDQPLEIFGYWQTDEYDPPTAENGIVPRNAYGNVELFKPTMLPKKCVHIRLNGLNRVCKKLGIDCANAVVGFDFHQGACHPTFDGFVVCEEFLDQVTAAWYQDQEEQERKGQEKYEARVYGNWKKLIRGLLIRERLKLKYDF